MADDKERETNNRLASLLRSENWWACWFGFLIFLLALAGIIAEVPRPQSWISNPLDAFSADMAFPLFVLLISLIVMHVVGTRCMESSAKGFVPSFVVIFSLGFLAHLISRQVTMRSYGLEYVLWALVIGMVISNTKGLPKWMKGAIRTELYIKTGLVILGAEILFSSILDLGINGLLLAWGVTPVVLCFTYAYGFKKLKVERALALLIAAATSVCGVSAAIAVAAASRAKKEHLTLTISMSLTFTAVMLVGLPALVKTSGLDYMVGGAWIGGTVDSTGAVVAAGEILGEEAMEIATVVKLIQNVMIGIIAFAVAVLWVTKIEKSSGSKPSIVEVWYRFPKFILGFVFLSLITSFVLLPEMGHENLTDLLKITKGFRSYLFGIAFVCIGLETDFRVLRKNMGGGKPLQTYIIGSVFNLALTLLFAWLLFS